MSKENCQRACSSLAPISARRATREISLDNILMGDHDWVNYLRVLLPGGFVRPGTFSVEGGGGVEARGHGGTIYARSAADGTRFTWRGGWTRDPWQEAAEEEAATTMAEVAQERVYASHRPPSQCVHMVYVHAYPFLGLLMNPGPLGPHHVDVSLQPLDPSDRGLPGVGGVPGFEVTGRHPVASEDFGTGYLTSMRISRVTTPMKI
ncbi:hypothetical protein BC834DRAFT_45 [Gloeopeniophorella convolvens]|nr:hypothetical protein BC834DRAFT_45 [Gloeopeniophorella convolvens]